MYTLKKILHRILPRSLVSLYHWSLSLLGVVIFGYASKTMIVIGVTGTKGKTSTTEYINAIFQHAGYKTALLNTIHFKIGAHDTPNKRRMSMPGRMFMHSFLAQARDAQCSVAILEMTSEGARQHRHRFIALDALVFTNLAPEHIESHGSFEAYAAAKLSIGEALVRSPKRPRVMVANAEDAYGAQFLSLPVDVSIPFSLEQVRPYEARENGGFFTFDGIRYEIKHPGAFSLKNALAATLVAHAFGIDAPTIQRALQNVGVIKGRAEIIDEGQSFLAIVDYAHTPDSLKALYEAYPTRRKVCVLGATGGGRDMRKRPDMGAVADQYCDVIILTNEDPYDEDPRAIIEGVKRGVTRVVPEVLYDRREAIRRAIALANPTDVILITGKGTDPSICGPGGTQVPWSDAQVTREEIRARVQKS